MSFKKQRSLMTKYLYNMQVHTSDSPKSIIIHNNENWISYSEMKPFFSHYRFTARVKIIILPEVSVVCDSEDISPEIVVIKGSGVVGPGVFKQDVQCSFLKVHTLTWATKLLTGLTWHSTDPICDDGMMADNVFIDLFIIFTKMPSF